MKHVLFLWILLKLSLKVSEKQMANAKQNRVHATLYLVSITVASRLVIYCQNRTAATAHPTHAKH